MLMAQEESAFPYQAKLDFGPLLEFWKINLENNVSLKDHPVKHIISDQKKLRELNGPVEDILEKQKETVGMLLSAIFPPAMLNEDIAAVHIPFQDDAFYATPKYQSILLGDGEMSSQGNVAENCTVIAGLYILRQFYRPDLELDLPVIVNTTDPQTQLERVYNLEINTQFAEIELTAGLPELSDETIELLLKNLHDHTLWKKHLPADRFIFKGFTINRLTDVTPQEMLSSVKYYLLKRDAVTCGVNFLTIQQKIRSLFKLPELQLGIVFFDASYNVMSNSGLSEWNSFLAVDPSENMACCDYFQGSIYNEVFENKKAVIIEDLTKLKHTSYIEQNLLKKGIRNIGIAPLVQNGKILGMLELATPYPGKLNPMNAAKLANVLPMFTAAIQRVLEDLKMEVRAIIQKECTSIHPSVEWKFIEEGYNLIRKRSSGEQVEMAEIVFEKVYPLFGMSDIRNSSVYRNSSIREDLVANLEEAGEILTTLYHHKQMHIFNELNFRVTQELKRIKKGLASGDESNILEFIRTEINEALKFIGEAEKDIQPLTKAYFDKLDPEYGVVYKKRRAFEESLTRINETISGYIDEAEVLAQEIYPHYFEKYKTDGVEYNMYVGQSMIKDKEYNPLYLKNFRLWQLVVMCEIGRKIEALQPELTHPLEITQLILVQNEPLDIRFRKDEKHFDVDGAYNIRYEIIKKRIDKAYIKDTTERLTQTGKISIVYTHEKEAAEYLKYIQYLQSMGCLTDEVERLELEDLQGAQGLKALRVSIHPNMEPFKTDLDRLKETVEGALL
jgi:GAF domain-containing protein